LIISSFLFLFISYRSEDATKIDEYVPIIVPKIIININPLILSGQKKNTVTNTKSKVKLVNILLLNVSQTDLSTTLFKSSFFLAHSSKFDLILSNITIVSLIEYHNIVNNAVIKNVSILNSGKKDETVIYNPDAITTS